MFPLAKSKDHKIQKFPGLSFYVPSALLIGRVAIRTQNSLLYSGWRIVGALHFSGLIAGHHHCKSKVGFLGSWSD
jgi:hypothetical protein